MNSEKVSEMKVRIIEVLAAYYPDNINDLAASATEFFKLVGLP